MSRIRVPSTKQLVFEKSITRDWSLFFIEILHRELIKDFKKQYGFGYSEMLFDIHSGYTDIYRAPAEHIHGMRAFILKELKKNPDFIKTCSKKLMDLYSSFLDVVKKINSTSLKFIPNQKFKQLLDDFIEIRQKTSSTFVIIMWFPMLMENYSQQDKYQKDINFASKVRAKTDGFGPETDQVTRKIAGEVCRRMFNHTDYAKFLSLKEINAFLIYGKIPNESELKKRSQGFVYGLKGIAYISLQKYATSEGVEIKELEDKDITTSVKGKPAFCGIVKGRVRLLLSKTKINLLRKGEILVTGMTTPEFVPAMKKAGAIVTDEGGITCHAAIVSREMKIPCIIGTKIATRVLKDGDLVEVDANKGIVKKLT